MMNNSIIRLLPDEMDHFLYTQFDWEEGENYKHFPEGVEFVALERTPWYRYFKLTHLQSIAASLKFINPQMDTDRLEHCLFSIIENHFYRGFPESRVREIAEWVIGLHDSGRLRPSGRKRKVIFRPGTSLTRGEKLGIVGHLTSRSVGLSEEMIYEVLEGFQGRSNPIKMDDIAEALGCSKRTLQREFTADLKAYTKGLNDEIRYIADCEKFFNAIDTIVMENGTHNRSMIKLKSGLSGSRVAEICNEYGYY